jgi:hypothetical protein
MTHQTFIKRIINSFMLLLLLTGSTAPAWCGEPIIWETSSRAELLRGEARGVSITDTGVLMLAPRFTQLFNTDQSRTARAISIWEPDMTGVSTR